MLEEENYSIQRIDRTVGSKMVRHYVVFNCAECKRNSSNEVLGIALNGDMVFAMCKHCKGINCAYASKRWLRSLIPSIVKKMKGGK